MDATHEKAWSPGKTPPSGEPAIVISPPDARAPKQALASFRCTLDGEWEATGHIGRSWRGPVLFEMTIRAAPDVDGEPGMIGASILRKLPTGAILGAAKASPLLADSAEKSPAEEPETHARPTGRTPLAPELLWEVALRYLVETQPGKPRGAIKRVAEQMGKPVSTVGRWVMRARAEQLLGPGVSGREGGGPGPRFIEAVPRTFAATDPLVELMRQIGY